MSLYIRGIIAALALVFLLPALSAAQKGYEFRTKSKEAVKRFKRALYYYENRDNLKALEELDAAVKIDSNFVEAQMLLGDVSADMGEHHNAVSHYRAAIRVDPEYFPQNFFNLAKSEMQVNEYDSALVHIESFLLFKSRSQAMREKAEKMRSICRFAAYAVKHPVPYDPESLGDSINSPDDEYLPAFTADDQTLVYTRRRMMGLMAGRKQYNEDFYISRKQNDKWIQSRNMGPPINTSGNEGAHCLSPDGRFVFFTACNREGYRGCDLYYSQRIGSRWLPPVNMGKTVNSPAWDSQPSISSDGRTIYFLSSRHGGYGKQDIWMTTQDENGNWGEPVNLGPEINTTESELSPFIHADNMTLYFASEGHPGMGGTDLYVSRRGDDGKWQEPLNMGFPINTSGDESSLFVNAAGTRAFFATNRMEGGRGGLDIYGFDLYEEVRPASVSYVNGTVRDRDSRHPLEAEIEIIDLESGEPVARSISDKKTGEYLVCLPSGRDYAFNVSRKGYLFHSDHFSCRDPKAMKDAYRVDIELSRVKAGEKVVLRNLFFDTNEFTLKSRSFPELRKAAAFLALNPGVRIEVSGHTDNVGDATSNQVLSENRARAVYDYLVDQGVSKTQLSYKGYGEREPVADNSTDAGRAANRRTEFSIVSVN